jgi:hypothetical protein
MQRSHILDQVAHETNQSCHLGVLEGGHVVIVAQVDSHVSSGFYVRTGAVVDLMHAATGHVILAHQTSEVCSTAVEIWSDQRRERPPRDLTAHLAKIQSRGYEERASYEVDGVINISFPVGAAGLFSAGFGSPLSHRAAVPPQATKTLIPGLTPYIRLYGATAATIEGNAKLDDLKISVNCKGSSRIKWNVTALEEGEYDLFISCAVPSPSCHLELISGSSSIKSDLKFTEGVYRSSDGGWSVNFEKMRLDGRLYLTRGINPVTLQVSGADTNEVVRLRCLEALPASANAEMTAAEESARAHRACTDWFVKAGYGAMFHWTDFTQPRDGMKKPYPEAVNAFDADAFARLMGEIGAAYVIFTLNHAHPHSPLPSSRGKPSIRDGQRDAI